MESRDPRTDISLRARSLALAIGLMATAAQLAAQAATPVNLYVADLKYDNGSVHVVNPRKLTGDRGVNSQPAFSLDGKSILFVSRRDTTGQSDVYRIDLASGVETQLTTTPENENTPTPTADGGFMVIRWTPPTLFKQWGPWIYDGSGKPLRSVLPGPDTVGYYVPINANTYAMMRPKSRPAVAIFDARRGTMTDYDWPVANLPPQLEPSHRFVSYTRIDSLGHNEIRQLDLASKKTSQVASAVLGRTVHSWTPNGFILMGKGNSIYALKPGRDADWQPVAVMNDPELQSINTYVVSPHGDKVILISPIKPPLQQALRDSIQSGKSIANVLAGYRRDGAAVTTRYDVSEGGIIGLAEELSQRGNLSGSILVLHYASELFPKSHAVPMTLGDALRKSGDSAGAVAAYRRSLELNPRTAAGDKVAAEAAEKALAELSHN